jgi:hypothetical protein
MPRTHFLIVDSSGQRLGTLKALRETWSRGEQLVTRGTTYVVTAIVTLDQPDISGAMRMLVVDKVGSNAERPSMS